MVSTINGARLAVSSRVNPIGTVGSAATTTRPAGNVASRNLLQQQISANNNIENALKKASEQNEAYLAEAKALYEPYRQTGLSSLDEYTKLLLGGVDSLSGDKNFQDMRDLAERKVMANRAVSGLMRSGATASALTDAELNFANKYYGDRLSQLATGAGMGAQATGAQASIFEKLGTNATDLASALANIKMQRESNQAMIDAAKAQAGATTSAAKSAAKSDIWSSAVGALGTAALAFALSDKRLKEDLKKVGKSENGLNIYLGKYKKESGLDDGKKHLFLIAQEVKDVVPEAVIEDENGYLRVNYEKALGE